MVSNGVLTFVLMYLNEQSNSNCNIRSLTHEALLSTAGAAVYRLVQVRGGGGGAEVHAGEVYREQHQSEGGRGRLPGQGHRRQEVRRRRRHHGLRRGGSGGYPWTTLFLLFRIESDLQRLQEDLSQSQVDPFLRAITFPY